MTMAECMVNTYLGMRTYNINNNNNNNKKDFSQRAQGIIQPLQLFPYYSVFTQVSLKTVKHYTSMHIVCAGTLG